MPLVPGAGPIARLLPAYRAMEDARIRQAAWVARCVGRGEAAPLRPDDVAALAGMLQVREVTPGQVAWPGDVDGDIPLLLAMPMPYTGRALTMPAACTWVAG